MNRFNEFIRENPDATTEEIRKELIGRDNDILTFELYELYKQRKKYK